MTELFFPPLARPGDKEAIRVGSQALTFAELAAAAAAVAEDTRTVERVAVWADTSLETCVAVIGAVSQGVTVVPINPKAGSREIEHIVSDSRPSLVLARADADLPSGLTAVRRLDVDAGRRASAVPEAALTDEHTVVILYTSGTTGAPKGVLVPKEAIISNLDALAEIWHWTAADVLTHALPLFHVHGLVLGVLGPVRRGCGLVLVERFSPGALAAAFDRGATMMFAVPTMYHRIALEAQTDEALAAAFGRGRLLVSGSAALPAVEHQRMERLVGQRIVERYGMTETLMNVAVRIDEPRLPGSVGRPVPGVDVRLVDDDGNTIEVDDDETIGEIVVRGPNLFTGYLNRPDATAEVLRDGWFFTGDLATWRDDGYLRIVGRRATDLIKSGGFKIGAGEIEAALLEHPAVAEAAAAGLPDPDLGERIAAWVVLRDGASASPEELTAHVTELLAAHKRPREYTFLPELPRNPMGKVIKKALVTGGGSPWSSQMRTG